MAYGSTTKKKKPAAKKKGGTTKAKKGSESKPKSGEKDTKKKATSKKQGSSSDPGKKLPEKKKINGKWGYLRKRDGEYVYVSGSAMRNVIQKTGIPTPKAQRKSSSGVFSQRNKKK